MLRRVLPSAAMAHTCDAGGDRQGTIGWTYNVVGGQGGQGLADPPRAQDRTTGCILR